MGLRRRRQRCLHAKDACNTGSQEPGSEHILLRTSKGTSPADTFPLDGQPPGLCESECLLL